MLKAVAEAFLLKRQISVVAYYSICVFVGR